MIDEFDFKEPNCVLCGGKDFYYPNKDDVKGRIPVKRIIEKIDSLFNKNDYSEAGRLLKYWQNEAISLGDKEGELSIVNELIGYFRKINDKESAYKMIDRANELLSILKMEEHISNATILLNIATAFNAFNDYKMAIEIYQKTLYIYTKSLNAEDLRFAGLFNNMALALVKDKQYKKAEEYYQNAIKINKNNQNTQCDLAITYVNLAHLYNEFLDSPKEKVIDSLFSAYELLNDDSVVQNGYYAYVLEKCAPSFAFFGFDKIEKELTKRSKEIYERN